MCRVCLLAITKIVLLFLLTLGAVRPQRTGLISVKEGELVAFECPGNPDNGNNTLWKHETSQMYLHNMSATELRQRNLLLQGKHLVILRASQYHQGNYSCSLREANKQFMLRVYSAKSGKYEEEDQYPTYCKSHESCSLACPHRNIPPEDVLEMTSTIWYKPDGKREHSPSIYFSNVTEADGGNYTCFRSWFYHHQTYNRTFRIKLHVKPKEDHMKSSRITEPKDNEVVYVDIDSPKVIDCKAVLYSYLDDVFWSDVEKNESLPVFYNYTSQADGNEQMVTASLVFQKVSERDLTKTYTCKLESDHQDSNSVKIRLSRRARPSYFALIVCSVCIVSAVVVTTVVYIKFKVDITLFMRDTVGCQRNVSDGKSYDIFLMSYKSESEGELNGHDRRLLESVLQERFGYSLCLFDRDVLPGESTAEAVLDCVERSRTVVLVPTSPDPGSESELLSALHAALVERQTRLVFITTEKTGLLSTGSIPEALQLLSEAGDHVTWKGSRSVMPSSAFWKQLRYYLPAPHHPPKSKLLPLTIHDVNLW